MPLRCAKKPLRRNCTVWPSEVNTLFRKTYRQNHREPSARSKLAVRSLNANGYRPVGKPLLRLMHVFLVASLCDSYAMAWIGGTARTQLAARSSASELMALPNKGLPAPYAVLEEPRAMHRVTANL